MLYVFPKEGSNRRGRRNTNIKRCLHICWFANHCCLLSHGFIPGEKASKGPDMGPTECIKRPVRVFLRPDSTTKISRDVRGNVWQWSPILSPPVISSDGAFSLSLSIPHSGIFYLHIERSCREKQHRGVGERACRRESGLSSGGKVVANFLQL